MNSLATAYEIVEWREAAQRGCVWLTDQIDRMPSFRMPNADLNWYAKVAWATAVCGRRLSAMRVLEAVVSKQLYAPSHRPERVDGTNAVPYALGWLVVGARLCERYDVARVLYDELQRYWCPDFGGISSVPAAEVDDQFYFDTGIQGAMLHAAIAMGDLARAARVGDLMTVWFAEQPNVSQGIFMMFHPRRGYLQDVNDETRFQRLLAADRACQPFANLGFVIQGLIRLAEASGDHRYLAAAQNILDPLLEFYGADLLAHSQNHKVAHAAIMAYRHSAEPRYLDAGVAIARRMAARILSDGRALADVLFQDIESQSYYTTVRTTCDSVLWLQSISDELESVE